jgi:putative ABC transport system substrate-binding protein
MDDGGARGSAAECERWHITMKRRGFIGIAGGAAAWPLGARTQQKAMPVIGFLGGEGSDALATRLAAFRRGLSETGYVEGQNVAIEYRWAEGRFDRLPELAADLVNRKVNVIVTQGGNVAALAAKNATSAIPIVFLAGGDPVGTGLVASFNRPGGNLTGISLFTIELNGKRVDLISELAPEARVLALLVNPNFPAAEEIIRTVQEVASAKRLQLRILKAATESEINAAFGSLAELKAGALLVFDPTYIGRREQIVALAERTAIPALYEWREFAAAGGLISYGPSVASIYREMGLYTGKVLNGAKPADLPVQQPTTFELVINLKTAKALGLTVPQSLLARADEIIE